MAINCGFCTMSLLQKISKIYAYVAIAIYLGIVIFVFKQNPRYRRYDTELGIATIYVFVVILMITSIYGESKKQLKLMTPNLIVQLLFTCSVFFFTILALITAAYDKIWSHINLQEDTHRPSAYVYSVHDRDYDTFIFYRRLMLAGVFALISVINGVFGFYLPYQRFKGLRKEHKQEKRGLVNINLDTFSS